MATAGFVGRGLAFPLRPSRTGGLALVGGRTELEEAIATILGTAKGERPMRPAFGCGIHDHVFDPINDTTLGTISYEVQQALRRWEPRIDVVDVRVLVDHAVDGLLYLDIVYRVKTTNDERNLVFPFYTIPDSEG